MVYEGKQPTLLHFDCIISFSDMQMMDFCSCYSIKNSAEIQFRDVVGPLRLAMDLVDFESIKLGLFGVSLNNYP